MLENLRWQPIPGCASGSLFPVLRKPDAICANAYLIQTDDCLAVIDPGADPAQTALILDTLDARLRERPRPVLILLTHCHRDHAWGAAALLDAGLSAQVLLHARGARALAERDRALTVAYLFNEEVPPIVPLVPLLAVDDLAGPGTRPLAGAVGSLPALQTGAPEDPDTQILHLGPDARIRIEHTPGHSPDSLTYWLGELCFPGDLPIVTGLHGVPGWEPEVLIGSLERVARRLSDQGRYWVCGGHGPPLPSERYLGILAAAGRQARDARPTLALDGARADYLKRYAVAALRETAHLLTLIGARLQFVAVRLEQLEEFAEAERVAGLLDDAAIETLLMQFRQYAERPEADVLLMALPLKGLQLLGRMESLFDGETLGELLDPAWLPRARHLMTDYCNTLRGLDVDALTPPADINQLVFAALSRLKRPQVGALELLERCEQPAAFARALAARIGQGSWYRDTDMRIEAELGLPLARIDGAALEDALIAIVERLVARGARRLRVSTAREAPEGRILLCIATELRQPLQALGDERHEYLTLALQRYQVRIDALSEEAGDAIRLRLDRFVWQTRANEFAPTP